MCRHSLLALAFIFSAASCDNAESESESDCRDALEHLDRTLEASKPCVADDECVAVSVGECADAVSSEASGDVTEASTAMRNACGDRNVSEDCAELVPRCVEGQCEMAACDFQGSWDLEYTSEGEPAECAPGDDKLIVSGGEIRLERSSPAQECFDESGEAIPSMAPKNTGASFGCELSLEWTAEWCTEAGSQDAQRTLSLRSRSPDTLEGTMVLEDSRCVDGSPWVFRVSGVRAE